MIGGQDPEPRRAPSLLDVLEARKRELAALWREAAVDVATRGGTDLSHDERDAVSALVDNALGSLLSFDAGCDALLQTCEADRGRLIDVLEHGEAVFVVDEGWRVVLVNESLERLLGVPREEALGRNVQEVVPVARSARACTWRELERVMQERIRTQFEVCYAPRELWLDVYAYPTREGGVAVFLRDVTERKRTETEQRRREDLLRTMADSVSAAIYLKDTEGRHLLVNRHFEEIFQLEPGEAIGRTDLELLPSRADAERIITDDRRVFELKKPMELDVEVTHPDGTKHVYATVKVPLLDERGEPWALCGISTDVTERKRLAEELGQVAEMRERLLRVVSHDLRNPLSAIVLGLGMLKRRIMDLGDSLLPRVENVERAAARMQRLLTDLLDMTRAETGSLEVTMRRARACALLEDVAEAHAPLARERGVQLVVRRVPDDVEVCCDPGRVEQMFANLIENALKFTPEGGTVEIGARTEPGEVCFWVADTGPGIAPELRGRLFEPYVTSPSPGGRAGTGLGLFITRSLAEAQRGRIWAEDAPGGGARLCFTLPRAG